MELEKYLKKHRHSIDSLKNLEKELTAATDRIIQAFHNGNKVLIAGNGGSASDAQHLAGEMVGRYRDDRIPLPAVALSADGSVLTCIGNDFGYEEVFARQVKALGSVNDVFIGFSTSGRSPNIIRALDQAAALGMLTILFTGSAPGPALQKADIAIAVDSTETGHIQEAHLVAYHYICERLDAEYVS